MSVLRPPDLSTLKERVSDGTRPIREFLAANPIFIAVVGFLLCVLLIAWSIMNYVRSDQPITPSAYFVDQDTLTVVTRSTLNVPPFTSGGATYVYGIYMACGTCKDKKLAYLQKYSDNAKKALDEFIHKNGEMPGPMQIGGITGRDSVLIRLPDKSAPWVPLYSPEAQGIRDAFVCPENVSRIPCFPG